MLSIVKTVAMGELILLCQVTARRRTTSRAQSFLCYVREYRHLTLVRPLAQDACWLPEGHQNRIKIGLRPHTLREMLRDPKRGEAPGHRRCRLCDPASGQCRHLCVRPSGPNSEDNTPSTRPGYGPAQGEHSPSRYQASAFASDIGSTTSTQFHPPAAG